jgi:hypothetical protein
MTPALKFILSSATVWFYRDEVMDGSILGEQSFQVQTHQDGTSNIFRESNQYDVWNIDIYEAYADTRSKIQQLVDAMEVMQVYYLYLGDPSLSKNMILLPDEIKREYSYGGEGLVTHTLKFLEV